MHNTTIKIKVGEQLQWIKLQHRAGTLLPLCTFDGMCGCHIETTIQCRIIPITFLTTAKQLPCFITFLKIKKIVFDYMQLNT